jgi:hypothetical protein
MASKPPASAGALAIFASAKSTIKKNTLKIQGVCQNLLVAIHTDESCKECAEYAQHLAEEISSSNIPPIPNQELEEAITIASPSFLDGYHHESEVKDLQSIVDQCDQRADQQTREIKSLEKSLEKAREEREHQAREIARLKSDLVEAESAYRTLQNFVLKARPGTRLPPDFFKEKSRPANTGRHTPTTDGRARSSASKRARDPSPESGLDYGDQYDPQDSPHRDKRPKTTSARKQAEDVVMKDGTRVPVNYGDIVKAPPKGSFKGNPGAAFDGSSDEFAEDVDDDDPRPLNQRSGGYYELNLPEKYRWIVDATGQEPEFKALAKEAYHASPDGAPHYEVDLVYAAVKWRTHRIARERRKGVPSLVGRADTSHYPEEVMTIIKEWERSPIQILPCVRQDRHQALLKEDLDVTAWLRMIRPKGNPSAYKRMLTMIFMDYNNYQSVVDWTCAHEGIEGYWMCSRPKTRLAWSREITPSALLQWIIDHGRMTKIEGATLVAPYFQRSATDKWYNDAGRIAMERYKDTKEKGPNPFPPSPGPPKSPEELRQRALAANNMLPEQGSSGQQLIDRIQSPRRSAPSTPRASSRLADRIQPGPPKPPRPSMSAIADAIVERIEGKTGETPSDPPPGDPAPPVIAAGGEVVLDHMELDPASGDPDEDLDIYEDP